MVFNFRRILPHFLVVAGFIITSIAYFNPILKGKQIFQSDIMHYIGMAQQQKSFAKSTGEETYWTNSAFGGMPTYQLGAKYPNNYIKKLDRCLRFLPRPADYLFLYFIGLYVLLLCLKVDYKLAVLGALAFGFSTYLIIIIGVGHNSKAHAIAYMPLVLSGILLVFRDKKTLGFILTATALGLELVANHYQMTYYLLLLVICLGISFFVDAYKKRTLRNFFKSMGILTAATIIALGLNASNILATKEYVKDSTRGKSELTLNPDGSSKTVTKGLGKNYITEYSYGISETFNLFIPRFMGGGNAEDVGKDSETYNAYIKLGASHIEALRASKNAPMYWGKQPIVEAPAYIGAVIIFLFVLSIFLLKGNLKRGLLSGVILALLLSYGKNFNALTNFFIDYVPLYNKFRAVSSIQVILELSLPILAVLGLAAFFNIKTSLNKKNKALIYTLVITGGLCIIFLVFGTIFFDFEGLRDDVYLESYGKAFVNAIVEDRKVLFLQDTFRSLIFVCITAAILFLFIKEKASKLFVIIAITILIVIDLVSINRNYVNNDNFVSASKVQKPYTANSADREIHKDTSHFRVLDVSSKAQRQPAKASFFHNSILGYHAAKLGRYNDILEFYIYNNNQNVLNMLNTKYIIAETKDKVFPYKNTEASGNAWFVSELKQLESANEEINALENLNFKTKAITTQDIYKNNETKFIVDSTANISLVSYKPNHLKYLSSNHNKGFVVFSEIYYGNGWNAYVNNNKVAHYRVNYLLRGLEIPKGNHTIEFKFEPSVVTKGSKLSLVSSILLLVLIVSSGIIIFRKPKQTTP